MDAVFKEPDNGDQIFKELLSVATFVVKKNIRTCLYVGKHVSDYL